MNENEIAAGPETPTASRLSWWGRGMLVPFIGWIPLDLEDTHALDLPVHWHWEMLSVAWLGFALTIAARRRGRRTQF